MTIGKQYHKLVHIYLEGFMFEGIPKCDQKTWPNNIWGLDKDYA